MLVAQPTLPDPNFSRSVVLVAHHDAEGALGLVLNRPGEFVVGDAAPELADLTGEDAVIDAGGPVQPDALLVLAEFEGPSQAGICVVENVGLVGDGSEIEELVEATRNGGAEIVALLKTGSAYYAPSAAAARMARAVMEDSGAVMPVCAWVDGEYGINGVYLGVEAEIGREGVRKVVEGDLSESELAGLREAAEAVRAKQADVADL